MQTCGGADIAALLRSQFHALESVGVGGRFDADVQRRLLLLEHETWSEWSAFRQGGKLPAQPAVPVMLRRMAVITYRLAALQDQQATSPERRAAAG